MPQKVFRPVIFKFYKQKKTNKHKNKQTKKQTQKQINKKK